MAIYCHLPKTVPDVVIGSVPFQSEKGCDLDSKLWVRAYFFTGFVALMSFISSIQPSHYFTSKDKIYL